MISKKIQKALAGSSAIRAMFVEGNELAAKVGRENVYDFSLGNPATPAPAALNEAVRDLVDELDPLTLHGYMDNAGCAAGSCGQFEQKIWDSFRCTQYYYDSRGSRRTEYYF